MTTPPSGGPVSWQVTGQTEQTQISQGGSPVRGVQVFFTTGQGHEGSVFVPYVQYNPQTVRTLVGTAAAQMDAIGALNSQTPVS